MEGWKVVFAVYGGKVLANPSILNNFIRDGSLCKPGMAFRLFESRIDDWVFDYSRWHFFRSPFPYKIVRQHCQACHKIMVSFSGVANKYLQSNTPPNGYYVSPRIIRECGEQSRDIVTTLWDKGYVTIEIVRNDAICGYYRLPKDAVIARDITKVIIEPVGENPDMMY